MGDAIDALADLWRWYGDQFRRDSPIYGRIAEAVANDREILQMFSTAPPAAHLPPAPLAAVNYLILGGLDHPLADVYHAKSAADPGPLYLDLCRAERASILALLETRRVQTNDCGRSAIIGPALTWAAARVPGPYCLIDVGASAGINLLCDRYRLDYGDHGSCGPIDSPVHVTCEVTGGNPPIADRLPAFDRRLGIDLSPIDLTNDDDAQWLLACVWPDTGRSDRVEASIRLARQDPPPMIAGRANDVLPDVLAELPSGVTALVVTTWAFSYFSISERSAFVELLRTGSTRRHIVWVSADNAGESSTADALSATVFDDGVDTAYPLANVHSHGNWINWHAPSP